MKHYRSTNKAFVFLPILIALFLFLSFQTANAKLTATANHDHISVDFFYHGSTVSVRGISDPGTDLVIKFTSDEGSESLRKKGKVGGLLWMNTGELDIEHVPNFYSVHSTKKVEDILSEDELNKYVIGYPALEKHVTMNTSDEGEKAGWFKEFKKFKEKNYIIIGMSADSPVKQKNFAEKYGFQYPLLSDESKEVLKAYHAWGIKKLYGREYEGIMRISYLIDENGKILKAYSKVKTKSHAEDVLSDIENLDN